MLFSALAKEFERDINETNITSQNQIRDCRINSPKEKIFKNKLYYSKKEDKIITKRQEIKERKLKRGTKLLKRNLDGNQDNSSLSNIREKVRSSAPLDVKMYHRRLPLSISLYTWKTRGILFLTKFFIIFINLDRIRQFYNIFVK